ncbi:ABC transporter permease [Planctomycetota bacterium]
MSTFIHDIKFGIRMLAKRPGVTAIAILILALGIGANTALFTVIHQVLLSPFPFDKSERLMMVEPQWKDGGLNGSSSGPDYLDWRDRNTVFEALSAFSMGQLNLTKAGDALAVKGFKATSNFYKVFNEEMSLGRGFRPEEDQDGNQDVTVLSYRLWRQRYGCDPNILGQRIDIDKVPHTVVGVAAQSMGFIDDFAQIYVPLNPSVLNRNRGNHHLIVLGRLKEDVTIAQAQGQMNQVAQQLSKEYPNTNDEKGVHIDSLHHRLISNVGKAFYILYGAVCLLLLVACINISNLLVAKAAVRRREMAIRQALGGGRRRLIQQLLTESLLLGLAGGALGLLFAFGGLDLLQTIAPKLQESGGNIPGFDEIRVNLPMLGFTLVVSVLASLAFGLIPAWQSSGTHVNNTLKETGIGLSRGPGRHHTLGSLVVGQIALAFILLVGAGLLVKSFTLLQKRDPGFNPNGLLAVHIDRPRSRNTSNDIKPAVFFQQAVEQLAALPGVTSAGGVSLRPLNSDNNNSGVGLVGEQKRVNTEIRIVTHDYFRCMGIPLGPGRSFDHQDNGNNQAVVIVNREFVKRILPDRDPIGLQVNLWGRDRTIVGVVGNVPLNTLSSVGYKPFAYMPHSQHNEYGMTLFLRTEGDPLQWARAARQAIGRVDDNQPILYINTMSALALESVSLERFCTILIGTMATVALLMALVGLYAVMTFAVNERRVEVGIRMALGAEKRDILWLMTHKAFLLTLVGLVLGLVGALVVSRSMGSLLYQINTWDSTIFIAVPLLLFCVAMLACYIPARKATRLDPMKVLRYE